MTIFGPQVPITGFLRAPVFGHATHGIVARPPLITDPSNAVDSEVDEVELSPLDGTACGLAIAWWEADIREDRDALREFMVLVPAREALRSAVDVLLTLADFASRNDPDNVPDCGADLLGRLAFDPMVRPAQRLLFEALADQVRHDPDLTAVRIPPIPVAVAMSAIRHLSLLIEARFGIDARHQIASFRRQATTRLTGTAMSGADQ